MNKKLITYQEFIDGYKVGEFRVLVNEWKAGDFVESDFADKHYKPAHLFWSWTGILLTIPLPVIFLIWFNWIYAIGSFIFGAIVISAARKSDRQFILQNMLENEDFWNYVLLHNGAIIRDKQGNNVGSEFLDRMEKKFFPQKSNTGDPGGDLPNS